MMGSVLTKLADVLRHLSPQENRHHFTSAIILAAGSGQRFGQENGLKQFCPIGSIPALVHTLRAFEACARIDEILIVTSEADVSRCENYAAEFGIKKVSKVIVGGADRQESAKRGFDAVSTKAKFVAFHDGARCLVTKEIINDTIRAAYEHGVAVAAERSRDTVKIANDREFSTESPDRNTVWLAKTPQVFMADIYRAAVYTAEKDGVRATDDSMLAERLGFKVKMVECGNENIKLTTPNDIYIAEAILRARQEKSE